MVATSHPLAAAAGMDILRTGGNAFDAAVAVAAVLCVVEPMMTGIGGDMFALIYRPGVGRVEGLNASGRSAGVVTSELYRSMGYTSIPSSGIHSVSVPGVVDGWEELLRTCGSMTFKEVLAPAIQYAEHGFPVTEMVSYYWKKAVPLLLQSKEAREKYLFDGKAPEEGAVVKLPDLAATLKLLAERGRDAFYEGEIAERIDEVMRSRGGFLRKEDLAKHRSDWVTPISTDYRGHEVYQIPPNGQGLVVLQMLNILESFDLAAIGHNSADYIQLFAEAKKLAYADRDRFIADSEFADVPVDRLLSKSYARSLADRIREGVAPSAYQGVEVGGDTVYLTVADELGNIASVTNSIFSLFGSGEVVDGTGIFLQNRGSLFSLDPAHPNAAAPYKRPFHTIIPSMVMKGGAPLFSFGVMGADMQPQGQVQVLTNLIDFDMNVQQAGEAPRFRHYNEGLYLEGGIPTPIRERLEAAGYTLLTPNDGDAFGVGGYQGIRIDRANGTYQGGSDPRKDGCAIGY
ncbi:gamma-glutamyltransferase [Paenibacillus sp. TRM 82003]|nr:gamma-glutamyltransferase [Paenibacillus sp. TRM 82003]